ncbi:divalent metal cation transporter [Auritidibacter sp. NML130574]|uniref:divalent metal cation transporter n=1 Tax=Auritidibacter sp. NML130574 TaxID=2170745 RepID=UPI001FEDADC1|nr:divalent metal cation transporter [Auritidibacter sp. NML130574]
MPPLSARLGVMTNKGLAEIMRETFTHPLSKTFMIVLVVAAIGVGGAADSAPDAGLGGHCRWHLAPVVADR